MEEPLQDDPRTELVALARGLRAALRRRRALGVARIAASAAPPEASAEPAPPAVPAPRVGETARAKEWLQPQAPPIASRRAPRAVPPAIAAARVQAREIHERAQTCASLGELAAAVADCTACGLCETRTQTVFADGSGEVRLLFVGEAPGADEDARGVPFVGRAGQLLTDIVTKGMGLAREQVYIANVLKCRPPGNRDPSPAEKVTCTPWLDRQIELVDPAVIVPLGRHASNHVLGTDLSMGRLRGQVHERGGRKVVPTFHPAYLLRSPGMKKECWKDIQLAMGLLGLERPG